MTDPTQRLQYLRERQRIGAAYMGQKDEDWLLRIAEAALEVDLQLSQLQGDARIGPTAIWLRATLRKALNGE